MSCSYKTLVCVFLLFLISIPTSWGLGYAIEREERAPLDPGIVRDENGIPLLPEEKGGEVIEVVANQFIAFLRPDALIFPEVDGVAKIEECDIEEDLRKILIDSNVDEVERVFPSFSLPERGMQDHEYEEPPDLENIFLFHYSGEEDLEGVMERVRWSDDVLIVEPNYLIDISEDDNNLPRKPAGDQEKTFPGSDPNDPDWKKQWNMMDQDPENLEFGIGCPTAWTYSVGSPDIRVGIVEKGIQCDHPDLQRAASEGTTPAVVDGIRYFKIQEEWYSDDNYCQSNTSHSTSVTGLVGATTNNEEGVAGVAGGDGTVDSGCSIVAVEITTGQAPQSVIAEALVKAADDYPDGLFCDIINNSYTFSTYAETFRAAIRYCNFLGVSFVAGKWEGGGVGRDFDQAVFPADYDYSWVTSVSGYGTNGLLCEGGEYCEYYTTYGWGLDILAPGAGCWTLWNDSGYDSFAGTSGATPQVSGSIALVRSYVGNDYRPEDYEWLLKLNAWDPPEETDEDPKTWEERYGHGCLRIGNAMAAIGEEDFVFRTYTEYGGSGTEYLGPVRYTFLVGPVAGPKDAIVYKVTTNVAYEDDFVEEPMVWGLCNQVLGCSAANPSYSNSYSKVVEGSQGLYGCQLETYVFKVYNPTTHQFLGWWPCEPEYVIVKCRVAGIIQEEKEGSARNEDSQVFQAWPNPFKESVHIQIPMRAGGENYVNIFDIQGKLVKKVRAQSISAEKGLFEWDGKDREGKQVQSGIYFFEIFNRNGKMVKKVLLIK